MKTITILSQKGGSGKTTIAVNLAICIQQTGKIVAILDVDEDQWSAFDWNNSRPDEDQLDAAMAEARDLKDLKATAEENGVDVIIIDTAPRSRKEARMAVEQSDLVLIPCQPTRFDLRALLHSVAIAKLTSVPYGVVLSRVPRGRLLVEETREEMAGAGIQVLDAVVRDRAVYKHAVIGGSGVHEFDPGGEAAQEIDKLFAEVQDLLGGKHGSK